MYSEEQNQSLYIEFEDTLSELQNLMIRTHRVAGTQEISSQARDLLIFGFSRRLHTLERCVTNIFRIFPTSQKIRLDSDALNDVTINLQAFILNLSGCFDNLAWAFVHRHDLLKRIGRKSDVGIFLRETRKCLPIEIWSDVDQETFDQWHRAYHKDFRDALAHRIPLYLPPAVVNPTQAAEIEAIEREINSSLASGDWSSANKNQNVVTDIGSPSGFVHDTASGKSVWLHPQLLCDVQTLCEFANSFLEHWHLVNTK